MSIELDGRFWKEVYEELKFHKSEIDEENGRLNAENRWLKKYTEILARNEVEKDDKIKELTFKLEQK